MFNQCPGQDSRKAQAESIICTDCGYVAEIFSDEVQVKCPQCQYLICKERLPSCVNWCKAAKECIGEEKWKQFPPKADSPTAKKGVDNVLLSM